MSYIKLLPCPFCGERTSLHIVVNGEKDGFGIRCNSCTTIFYIPSCKNAVGFINWWNRRPV